MAGLGLDGQGLVGQRGVATGGGEALTGGEFEADEAGIVRINIDLDQAFSDQIVAAGADDQQVIQVSFAAGSPIDEVVELKETGVGTAGHSTPVIPAREQGNLLLPTDQTPTPAKGQVVALVVNPVVTHRRTVDKPNHLARIRTQLTREDQAAIFFEDDVDLGTGGAHRGTRLTADDIDDAKQRHELQVLAGIPEPSDGVPRGLSRAGILCRGILRQRTRRIEDIA